MALGTVVKAVIFGIDPSSRKLAVVHGEPGKKHLGHEVKTLPARRPDACLVAFEWVGALVDRYPFHHPYVVIEAPVFGRGGPGSTIPQAMINGALQAGAHDAGADVIDANNAHVKKEVLGRGNAKKDEIAAWAAATRPDLHAEFGTDQDLCDALMIWTYGVGVLKLRDRIAKRGVDVTVRRPVE